MIKPLRQIQSDDQVMQLFQSYIAETLAPIVACPIIDGRLLRQVSLKPGTNDVSHGLGRKYLSWCPMNASAFAQMAFGISPDPAKYIRVVVSSPCTADFWVF